MTWRSGVCTFEPFERIFWYSGILNLSTLGAIGVTPNGLVAITDDWLQMLDNWDTDPFINWLVVLTTQVNSWTVGVEVLLISCVVVLEMPVLLMRAIEVLRTMDAELFPAAIILRLNFGVLA